MGFVARHAMVTKVRGTFDEFSGQAVTGDLTIKDVTKSVTIDFDFNGAATDPYGNERIGFEGSATIVRSEFGIVVNAALETGGVLVSDKIQLEISAIKQA